jgi:metal-responsive CopG/Arc/MetJ family transcriptional regulator
MEVRMLKRIQITLPSDLLASVDQTIARLDMNRSAFARQAFEDVLFRLRIKEMERQDAEAYARQPQTPDEIAL